METLDRIKSESPKYFKKLRALAFSLGGSAIAIWTINETMNLELDPWFIKILKWIIAICIGIAGTATLTKK